MIETLPLTEQEESDYSGNSHNRKQSFINNNKYLLRYSFLLLLLLSLISNVNSQQLPSSSSTTSNLVISNTSISSLVDLILSPPSIQPSLLLEKRQQLQRQNVTDVTSVLGNDFTCDCLDNVCACTNQQPAPEINCSCFVENGQRSCSCNEHHEFPKALGVLIPLLVILAGMFAGESSSPLSLSTPLLTHSIPIYQVSLSVTFRSTRLNFKFSSLKVHLNKRSTLKRSCQFVKTVISCFQLSWLETWSVQKLCQSSLSLFSVVEFKLSLFQSYCELAHVSLVPAFYYSIDVLFHSENSIVIFSELIPQSVCSRYGLVVGAYMWVWPRFHASTVPLTSVPLSRALPTRIVMWIFWPVAWPVSRVLTGL